MSYSFIVRAPSKAEAKVQVAVELQKVADTQPIHAVDRAHAQATAVAYIDLLADDPTKTVQVNMHGSVSWVGPAGTPHCINAAVGVSAALMELEIESDQTFGAGVT